MVCPKCGKTVSIYCGESYFDGTLLQLLVLALGGALLTILTLGICFPWALCLIYDWEAEHTIINGHRLGFDGTGGQLFGTWIKWWLLSIITLGIYALWIPIKARQWTVKHTYIIDPALDENEEPDLPQVHEPTSGAIYLTKIDADASLLAPVRDYFVLDFETTGLSGETDKVVEVAAIKVVGGQIVDEYCTLVNPQQHISASASAVNHIYDEDVREAPLYDEVGEKLTAFLGDCFVVGHNIRFDLSFMPALLKPVTLEHDITWRHIDTMELARNAFPRMDNYKLQTLVSKLDIQTEGAHRARADALATQQLFELCRNEMIKNTAQESFGLATEPAKKSYTYHPNHKLKPTDVTPSNDIDEGNPLFGKVLVFTGELSISRREAYQIAADCGAIIKTSVSKKVDYLIVGEQDLELVGEDGISTKQEKALKLNEEGSSHIESISEEQFMSLARGIAAV